MNRTGWLGGARAAVIGLLIVSLMQECSGAELSGAAKIKQDAQALLPLFKTDLAKQFLAAADVLPAIEPRTLYRDPVKKTYVSQSIVDALPDAERQKLTLVSSDEEFYYNTKYGSPLAYARPLEILSIAGFRDVRGKKILDFGYGTIGHLRLLASLGGNMTGVDVDPMLTALYSAATDTGKIKSAAGGHDGSIKLVSGQFPADKAVKKSVGSGCDLIISKNTLKNGYLHPAKPVEKQMRVDLGVSDAEFVHTLHETLKPGGFVLIYNLSPAESKPDQPYKPWADGRCPFPAAMWEAAGFDVLVFDQDDGTAARLMGHALGWDRGDEPMNLENDLFAHYTLVRRKL